MRAAVIAGGRFEMTDLPDPKPGPADLLIEVTACGLCGSDVKSRPIMPDGTVMGHEFGGRVIGIGSEVSGWEVGTQAAVLPVVPCGTCKWCQSGHVIHCPQVQLVGLGGVPGGFAQYAVVSPLATIPIPAHVEPAHSALVEPFAVGLHAVLTGDVSAGDDVLIIGAGAVGSTSIAWSRLHGANRITAVDPTEVRRVTATTMGATDTVASLDEVEPSSYDVVIECVGKPGLLDRAVVAARPRSRVVIAGVCFDTDPVSSMTALMKETTVSWAVYYTPEEFRTVIAAFAEERLNPAPLLSAQLPLTELNEVFDTFGSAPSGAKVLLQP